MTATIGIQARRSSPVRKKRVRATGGPQHGRWFSRVTVFLLFVVGLIWLIPIIYMVSVSTRTADTAFDATLFSPNPTLANYGTVFRDNPLPQYFLNSLIISLFSTLLVAVCGLMFAYGSTVLKLPGSGWMQTLLLVTLMVPMSSLVLPLTALLKALGWINSYWGLIGPYGALGIPFGIIVLAGFLRGLPRDVMEAAIVDGSGSIRILWSIVLPMMVPTLIFVLVWQFITSWNEFFLALTVMTKDSVKPLTLVPQQYSGLYLGNPGALFAILTLVAAPLVIIYLLVQRWFVGGLLAGAVKG